MNDQQLIKYLLQETDSEENQAVQDWIEADQANQKQFEQLQWIWKSSERMLETSDIDEHKAWERFLSRKKTYVNIQPASKQVFLQRKWYWAVASILFILGSLTLISTYLPQSGKALYSAVSIQSKNSSLEVPLLDGTVITMNKNSSLNYSQRLFGKSREVNLESGEVFFDVKRNEKKPFIISTGEVTVTVLGTSFHVKKSAETTEVIVITGSVAVDYGDRQEILKPADKLQINNTSGEMVKSIPTNKLYDYYVSKKFVANRLPLLDLINALSEAYGKSIQLENEALKTLPITTTLEYGSLEENLEVIKHTLNLEIVNKNGVIFLK